jgi:fructan beta-fructosidase
MTRIFTALLVMTVVWCEGLHAQSLYQEQFRPQYHFTPPQQWMNDPNGLIYLDGEYHLFFQYNPYANKWGPMHWGHAVSRDMVHWQNLAIALFPDNNGTIFSGSAVFDRNNTSGLGSPGFPPVVAIFTYNNHLAENLGSRQFQTEGIAYSLDKGRTWTKYAANPVLKNPGEQDFRDPKVSWFESQHKWIMTLAVGDHVSFYSSMNLKEWTHESDFGKEWGAHGGVWECPDLIEMKIAGETANRHVLLVSTNPGGPNGGSATQYFIGEFDGHQFSLDASLLKKLSRQGAESPAAGLLNALWLDYGPDDYAGVTWSGVPTRDGGHLFLGWMNNWAYAQNLPTERWRGAMTIPRELRLVRTEHGLEVRSLPITELQALRTHREPLSKMNIEGETDLLGASHPSTGLLDLNLDLDTRKARAVSVSFRNSFQEQTVFRINRKEHRYELDRSRSGETGFSREFSTLATAPITGTSKKISLRILIDRSSLEIFINDGETVFTATEFPKSPYDQVVLTADETIQLKSATIDELQSAWQAVR